MHRQHHYIKSVLKFALLLFFIGHYSSSTMFYHMHEVDGQVYSHSHFFGFNANTKGVPVTSHSHTAKQFDLIQQYHQTHWTAELEFPAVPTPIIRYLLQYSGSKSNSIYLPIKADVRLRAPPAC